MDSIFSFALLAQTSPPVSAIGEFSFGWLFLKTILALIVVIGLALLFMRVVLPRLQGSAGRHSSRIKIIERLPIEARKAFYILEVDGKEVLVGSSENGLSKILDLKGGNEHVHSTGH